METSTIEATVTANTAVVITPQALLEHWQGHRRLTRRTIDAFPETDFYTFTIGGMRSFADLTMEMLDLAGPGVQGVVTGNWTGYGDSGDNSHTAPPASKEEVLARWDAVTEKINTLWPQINPGRFQEVDVAFGQYENPIYATILYLIDNEIHHRGQGYVYLRALGIDPPAFWAR